MTRYLLDTGIAQDFINDRRGVRARVDVARQEGGRIGICTPVLGELWAGVEGSETRDKNLQKLRHGLSRLMVWPYDNDAAEHYGRIFAVLRKFGRPIQQVDLQIAAIAFALGNCVVVSSDLDMQAIPRLAVENWAS